MGDIKDKKFYSTGFIPLSNDKSRIMQGLSSQLVSSSCVHNNNFYSNIPQNPKDSANRINDLLYPINDVKIEYNLPPIDPKSSCLRYLYRL